MEEKKVEGISKVIVDLADLNKKLGYAQKRWYKKLTHVSRNLDTGYAFEGDWLYPQLSELQVGTLILVYSNVGSERNWKPTVKLFRVEPDGTLAEKFTWTGDHNQVAWALAVRDSIAKIFEENTAAMREKLEEAAKEAGDKRVELLKFLNDLLETTSAGREKYFKVLKRSESSILFDICQMVQIMIRDFAQEEVKY